MPSVFFERRRRIHWLDGGAVACGASLSRDQFETLATDGTRLTGLHMPVPVTCPKCREALKRRIAKFADPGSEDEEDILACLQLLLR